MRFGKYAFDKTMVIAEIGDNHNGSVSTAKKLIAAAKESGADAVKLQTWVTEEVFTRHAPKAAYQESGSKREETLFEINKKLELSLETHRCLKSYADEIGIMLFSKAGSPTAVDMLIELDIPVIKIGSADLTYYPLLIKLGLTNKPLILSTGMATIGEVEESIDTIRSVSRAKLYLLHCTSNYPARAEDANLRAMETLRTAFHLPIGYSDHTAGIEVAAAAVALGACIIEKHLTLDKNMEGPDHRASLEPLEFHDMVKAIRNVERALGDGIKKPAASEQEIREKMRKSIVAAEDIPIGAFLDERNLTCKRPGNGVPSRLMPLFLGRKVRRSLVKDELLSLEDI